MPGGQIGRQVIDGTSADPRAVVGRRTLAFDDFHTDRPLADLAREKESLAVDGQLCVAGNEDAVAAALRFRVDADDAEAVQVDFF